MEPKLFAVAALIFIDKKVVAVSRKTNHNDFGLIGGKIDPGESPEEAIKREIFEEVGLTAKSYKEVYTDLDRIENGELRPCQTYLVEEWYGSLSSKENAVIKLIDPEELFAETNSFCKYNQNLFSHLTEMGMSYLWTTT